ncbi:hypothetical protein ACQ4PT_065741 [Festuca glaucescens]
MVVLVVATASDPASVGPAAAFLAMPGWSPGPPIPEGMESFTNGNVRLLKHECSIIAEDDLDRRWQEATGEVVSEVIFLSKHTAVSNRPALTVHPIGVPHLREDETPPQGGRPGWAALTNPRIGPWLRLLQKVAADQGLVPEFEILWKGLGLEDGNAVGTWLGYVDIFISLYGVTVEVVVWLESLRNGEKVLLGIGGGHYAPRHMDIVVKDGVWVGHLLSGYSLPMEVPPQGSAKSSGDVGGMWKHSIKVS